MVISLNKKFKKFENEIKKTALKILKILNKDKIAVEIYLTDNKKMRILNKKFRNKDKTTTVLSFEEPRNFILPPSKFNYLGEIYLNCEKRFKIVNTSVSTDAKFVDSHKFVVSHRYLLIHGLLHLFGYDHKKESDRIKMEKKEKYVYHRLRFRNIAN